MEQIEGEAFVWHDMNFFQLAKMVLEQMLAIVTGRIKVIKSKHSLQSQLHQSPRQGQEGAGPADVDRQAKFHTKVSTLKTMAYLIATICDHIDIHAAPSRDPRVNHKLKKNSTMSMVADILDSFMAHLREAAAQDQKTF